MKGRPAAMFEGRLTIVVPTYNRPDQFGRLAAFLGGIASDLRILVLDSSDPEGAARNSAVAARFGNMRYRAYDPQVAPFDKFADGLLSVESDYAMILADDDLLVPSALGDMVAFLDAHPQASAVHGHIFDFQRREEGIRIVSANSTGGQATGDTALDRLVDYLNDYGALVYSMMRTSVARDALAQAAKCDSIMMKELMTGAVAAIAGEVHLLEVFAHGRAAGGSHRYLNWHPLERICLDPTALIREYLPYRDALVALAAAHGEAPGEGVDPVEAARSIDIAHLCYVAPYLNRSLLSEMAKADLPALGQDRFSEMIWDMWNGPDRSPPGFLGINRSRKLRYVRENVRAYGVFMDFARRQHDRIFGITVNAAGGDGKSVRMSSSFVRNGGGADAAKSRLRELAVELAAY
jgi:glycosyltransferase domain-containing protein